MTTLAPTLAFFGIGPVGFPEMVVLGILGVLIFGRRLPEVGRSLGKGIVEFKKGLSGIEEDVESQVRTPPQIEKRPSAPLDTTDAAGATPATPGTPASEGTRSA